MARAPMPPQAAASQQMAPDPGEQDMAGAPGGDQADAEAGEQQPVAPPKPKHHEKKRKPASERLYGKKKSAHRHG